MFDLFFLISYSEIAGLHLLTLIATNILIISICYITFKLSAFWLGYNVKLVSSKFFEFGLFSVKLTYLNSSKCKIINTPSKSYLKWEMQKYVWLGLYYLLEKCLSGVVYIYLQVLEAI